MSKVALPPVHATGVGRRNGTMNEDLKRYLLPPLVAIPLVVGFLFIVIGAVEEFDPTLVGLGVAILVGNGVFWPLLFHKTGRDRREAAKARARRLAGGSGEEEEE